MNRINKHLCVDILSIMLKQTHRKLQQKIVLGNIYKIQFTEVSDGLTFSLRNIYMQE